MPGALVMPSPNPVRDDEEMLFILFRLYWHKLKTFNYITKLIMSSHNCIVTRNYITAKLLVNIYSPKLWISLVENVLRPFSE